MLTFLLGVYVGAELMALFFLWCWFTGRLGVSEVTPFSEEK